MLAGVTRWTVSSYLRDCNDYIQNRPLPNYYSTSDTLPKEMANLSKKICPKIGFSLVPCTFLADMWKFR